MLSTRCLFNRGVRITHFTFGAVDIDGVTYEHDVVIDRGEIHQRKKKASKKFREAFGHTPLSLGTGCEAASGVPIVCRHAYTDVHKGLVGGVSAPSVRRPSSQSLSATR